MTQLRESLPSAVDQSLWRVRAGWAPPPELRVSEFCDRELVVTTGPLAGTHWQTDFAPYQRGILDAFHEPGVETVVVMGSSQWGKTACAVGIVAYHMAHDPCPILVVEPTVDPLAKDFSQNRLEPVIAASPALRAVVSKRRSRDATNTKLAKSFRGGALAIGGANSAASLAARSTRLLILDEVDRYPAELRGEGSTIAVAMKRTAAYRRRRRIMLLSSPTLAGATIDSWFQRGDQRRYYVPCPSCGHMQAFRWRNVQWESDDPRTARLVCPTAEDDPDAGGCGYRISDAERTAILARGEWRPTAERREQGLISFHLWEAYSPLSSLAEIVAGFMRARDMQKAGDKREMHTWINTTLGEPVEPDQGDGLESNVLLLRREPPWDCDVPEGACCITMGVDTQDDRLEALVIGWGPSEESWFIDRQTLHGDTDQPAPWAALDELLDHQYLHACGQRLPIQATCIDSAGHRTTLVYDYAGRQAARRVFAIIGRDGQRPIVSSPSPRQWGREKRHVPLYTIGVDAAKALIVSRLGLTARGPGYVHLPMADWCDDELAAQLASERLVTKWTRGVPSQVWRKTRARNEALDCYVYALGALRLLHPDLTLLATRMVRPESMLPARPAPPPRGGFLGPRRKGWLS